MSDAMITKVAVIKDTIVAENSPMGTISLETVRMILSPKRSAPTPNRGPMNRKAKRGLNFKEIKRGAATLATLFVPKANPAYRS